MADSGKGLWALRNAKPQATHTGHNCEWVANRSTPVKRYRLEMDRKGVLHIQATHIAISDELHRMRGETTLTANILASCRDMDGNKLVAGRSYDKVQRDGKIFKVLEVKEEGWEPHWRMREYTPLSKTKILDGFTDEAGRKLAKGKDYKYIVKDGLTYEVHGIEREGSQERWEISKSNMQQLNTTPRRISEAELQRDFINDDGRELDIAAIRQKLANGAGLSQR